MTSPWTPALLAAALALLTSTCVSANYVGEVKIEQTKVTLICPLGEQPGDNQERKSIYSWKEDGEALLDTSQNYVIQGYSHKEVKRFTCTFYAESYDFYLKLKVCSNCVEVSLSVTVAIILGDLLFTGAVALAVYCVTKRKGRGAREFVRTGMDPMTRPPNRRGVPGPTVPDPDYAPLNQGHRDVYDRPNHKR